MTRERIEDMREVVLPFVRKRLLETNYENLGESDVEEFARDFNEILNLAIEALKQGSTTNPFFTVSGVNELAKYSIETIGHSDPYLQGMCNGIEYMRAALTDTEPHFFTEVESEEEEDGIAIDDIEQWARQNNYTIVADNWWEAVQDTINKYQQLQADYENRLKADMVAMLEEIKEQLREMHEDFFETEHFDEAYGVSDSIDVIQQKINDLLGRDENIGEERQNEESN